MVDGNVDILEILCDIMTWKQLFRAGRCIYVPLYYLLITPYIIIINN